MELGLEGKTALVLGAGGGLGRAIAASLAREGARVGVADVNAAALAVTVQEIPEAGARCCPLVWDLADLTQIDRHILALERTFGPVEVLINNTGGPPPTAAAGQPTALWTTHFNAMVLSIIAITDRVLPFMRQRQWGRIITSTSSGVIAPIPNLGLSNSLRLALVGWSRTLAREVARDGITCNVVLPGRVATSRTLQIDRAKAERERRTVEEVASESASAIAIGRYGRPEEYADVVAFLASERASYVTGSVVRVDGGLIGSI